VQAVPTHAAPRRFDIVHRTTYRYDKPVERSSHQFRLVPVHDRLQTLLAHTLDLKHDGVPLECRQIDFDDVFGNRVRRVVIERPFSELVVEARSKVEILDTDHRRDAPGQGTLNFRPLHARRAMRCSSL